MSKILVTDDEPTVRLAFTELLTDQGHEVITAANGVEILEKLERESPDLIITDICMPKMTGLEAFRQIRLSHPRLPVIFMTGQGTMDSAIEATKLGAFDYQLKPFDPAEMLRVVERALEGVRLMQRNVALNPSSAVATHDAIIGQSQAMQEVFKAIGRVAPTDATVLIRGESGVGKELAARAVYQHSQRAHAPLLAVNCVAIPESLLESELFGHERGAFTGAHIRRIGKFEQASGGTIFLDEIGDLPLGVQGKILRVLQERCFERVGGNETVHVDVRVLAATNRDLEKAINEGLFREDLYYRLNVFNLPLPPLRERREDLPALTDYFLQRFAWELKIERPVISDEARHLIQEYAWPGNVREFEHCIYRAMIFTHGYPIQADDILHAREDQTVAEHEPSSELDDHAWGALVARYLDTHSGDGTHERLVDELDRLLVVEALQRTAGNQTHAARLLGLTRPTLHAKIRKHGLGGE